MLAWCCLLAEKGDESTMNIKSVIPESYLLAYEKYMRTKACDEHCGVIHNWYSDSDKQEGYKTRIAIETYQMTEEVFGVYRDKEATTNKIVDYVNVIFDKCENLVNWQTVDTARKKINDNPEAAAEVIKTIMCSVNPAKAYDDAISFFGQKFDLLAYLFFVRNNQEYLPVSPRNFDQRFKKIGKEYIHCPKLEQHGTWNVYCTFIQCVKDIKQQLAERYPDENVTLLDAHSVLWVMGQDDFIAFYENNELTIPVEIREKETETCAKARIGQGEYRKQMLAFWDNQCAVTGCSLTDVLVASHAKPWKDCDAIECRDFYNGLILIPNLDQLFDKGFISFDDNGNILISSKLDINSQRILGITPNMKLRKIQPEHLNYLEYHRKKVFQK